MLNARNPQTVVDLAHRTKRRAGRIHSPIEGLPYTAPVLSKVRITGRIPPGSTKRRQVGSPVPALNKRIKT